MKSRQVVLPSTLRVIAGLALAAMVTGQASPAAASGLYSNDRFAEATRHSEGFAGMTAFTSLRLQFGPQAKTPRPTLGLQLGFGRAVGSNSLEGRVDYRPVRFADFRFDRDGVAVARISSLDLAPLLQPTRFNANGNTGNMGNFGNGWLLAALAVGAGLGICAAAGCFDGGDSSTDTDTDTESTGIDS